MEFWKVGGGNKIRFTGIKKGRDEDVENNFLYFDNFKIYFEATI